MNRIKNAEQRTHKNEGKTSLFQRIRLPIRIKITIPYLLLAILIAVGAAFLLTNIVFDTVEERFRNQLGEVGQVATELMVAEEERLLEVFRLLSNSTGIPDALLQHNPDLLRTLSIGIIINEQIDAVEFLDTDANLVLSLRHQSGSTVEDYAFTTGGGGDVFSEWDFVEKVIHNQVDQLGDKYSGYVQAEWGNIFYISGPVYGSDGEIAGVILVGSALENLTNTIHEKALGQITFYDFEGRPVSSSFYTSPPTISQDMAVNVIENQDQSISKIRELDGQREFSVLNITYTEVLAAWEIRGDVDIGILGAALQNNFFVNPSPMTRIQVIILIGISFFLVILVGIYLANIITKPLLGLVTASKAVAGGNLNVQLDLSTNDEINTLAESFREMIANLKQSHNDLLHAYDSALLGWSKALELRDKETEGHTQRVSEMTVNLARQLGYAEGEIEHIRRGAILHDIGKMGIPDKILHKPGPLDEEEWKIMKKHPSFAYLMLKDIAFLEPALDIPRYHHEHWDGSGYPEGLSGEEIPRTARIFSVIDAWDALTTDRPYRSALSHEEALKIIEEETGKQYDPIIVDEFKLMQKK